MILIMIMKKYIHQKIQLYIIVLDAQTLMDHENTLYSPNLKKHPPSLFKEKNFLKLNFLALFYSQV